MAQPKLNWTEVDSSNVKRIGYHDGTETLCVEFHNGGIYTYDDVPNYVYVDFVHAPSVGQYLNNVIKVSYLYAKYSSMLDLETNLASK